MKHIFLTLIILLSVCTGMAQSKLNYGIDPAIIERWHHLDPDQDPVWGVSTYRAHDFLKQYTPKQRVVVAVIGDGGDVRHEDLKDVLWVDPKATSGDIHGWNFFGLADGSNPKIAIREPEREFIRLKDKYLEADPAKLSGKELETYRYFHEQVCRQSALAASYRRIAEIDLYPRYAEEYKRKLNEVLSNPLQKFKPLNKTQVVPSDPGDKTAVNAFMFFCNKMIGLPASNWDAVYATRGQWRTEVTKTYESRCAEATKAMNDYARIDPWPSDLSKRGYGNSNVADRTAVHGTHSAGIIGAARNNGIGIDGMADVQLMFVRIMDDGAEETDKNVALAIMYAVDNGARIINMNFGKYLSPNPEMVYQALRYAEKKGVLVVHAAGDDKIDLDQSAHYPCRSAGGKHPVSNMIEVGASDSKGKAAFFSNYGKTNVDVFAPGTHIYSTVPGSRYSLQSGTDMAASIVSGVAAMIWNYFPDLSMQQIITILKQSAISRRGEMVTRPGTGTETEVDFSELCDTGAIVNAYRAVQLAAGTSKLNR